MTASLALNEKGKAGAGRFPTFPASGIARISNLVSPAGVHSASEHASTGLALIWVARGQPLHPGLVALPGSGSVLETPRVVSSAGQPCGRALLPGRGRTFCLSITNRLEPGSHSVREAVESLPCVRLHATSMEKTNARSVAPQYVNERG